MKYFQSNTQRHQNDISSHQGCSLRKGILRSFAKFKGKRLCQSPFFNKVAALRAASLLEVCKFIKKEILAQAFSCNIYSLF